MSGVIHSLSPSTNPWNASLLPDLGTSREQSTKSEARLAHGNRRFKQFRQRVRSRYPPYCTVRKSVRIKRRISQIEVLSLESLRAGTSYQPSEIASICQTYVTLPLPPWPTDADLKERARREIRACADTTMFVSPIPLRPTWCRHLDQDLEPEPTPVHLDQDRRRDPRRPQPILRTNFTRGTLKCRMRGSGPRPGEISIVRNTEP